MFSIEWVNEGAAASWGGRIGGMEGSAMLIDILATGRSSRIHARTHKIDWTVA